MLRVSTLYAGSAAASAAYYAAYLTEAPGEVPGLWCGAQADGLGLAGPVIVEALETLLSGCDPVSGAPLGRELIDRFTADGAVIPAVSGFDATFSAPKSLSVWWALTGDDRLLDAHDAAVAATLDYLERFGSTTRIRANGGRVHPESQGLSMATFRQTTSRADDPQIHTHAVISAKVQTVDGRWLALDARFLKRHQRMLGGLYQSALRSGLTARYRVGWESIVNGQAELAGIPDELLARFSKRRAARRRWHRSRDGQNPPARAARMVSGMSRDICPGCLEPRHRLLDRISLFSQDFGSATERRASSLSRTAVRIVACGDQERFVRPSRSARGGLAQEVEAEV